MLGDAVRVTDYASAEKLRYIEAVAHETMRVLPVSPLQGAEPNEDVVLGDVNVPKGTTMYLLAARAATASENFSHAASFRPERWLDHGPRASSGHNTHASLPFGAGPRFCPGRHLAMLEIKMVTAMVCRSFEVSRFPGAPSPEEVFSFTMMPKNLSIALRHRGL